MITNAQKNYLKVIFELGGEIELVSNKVLSEKLGLPKKFGNLFKICDNCK